MSKVAQQEWGLGNTITAVIVLAHVFLPRAAKQAAKTEQESWTKTGLIDPYTTTQHYPKFAALPHYPQN